jgi:Ca2+-binding RTX toxin-like protein
MLGRRAPRTVTTTASLALAALLTPGLQGASLAAEIPGTPGVDSLVGTPGDDLVLAGDGADYLLGEAGNDQLHGNEGADELAGGDGNDLLVGGPGADFLYAGAGADTLHGEDGVDYLVTVGDGTADTVHGGEGYDQAWIGAEDTTDGTVEAVYVDQVPECSWSPDVVVVPGCVTPAQGEVETVSDTAISGYALDRDTDAPVEVHLYDGDGTFLDATVANQEDDFGGGYTWRFTHNLGADHTFQVYALGKDTTGQNDGRNVLLPGPYPDYPY